jgi:tetratricopeptide (TPR) repeat protein
LRAIVRLATDLGPATMGCDEGLKILQHALVLDPRSVPIQQQLGVAYDCLGRREEALAAYSGALSLAPDLAELWQGKARVHLARGDSAAARTVLREAQRYVEPAELVATVATYNDNYWLLDEAQQRLLLSLPPARFADDTLSWGLALAHTLALRGDSGLARAYAETVRAVAEAHLSQEPENGVRRLYLGMAEAYLAHRSSAVREGERGVALLPVASGGWVYAMEQLVRIYTILGEPARAVATLEKLVSVSRPEPAVGYLRLDPIYRPLHGRPRFEQLVRERT